MNALLPQLETLKLSHFELKNGKVRFENVTTFDTGNADYTSPANLHFPRLQTLRTSGASERFNEYLAFLNEHNHLSHLHLTGYKMDDSQFQQLTAKLNDLVELTLDHESNFYEIQKLGSYAAVEFLESHHKVKRFNVINFSNNWKCELQERFKHGWSVNIIANGLSFERNSKL